AACVAKSPCSNKSATSQKKPRRTLRGSRHEVRLHYSPCGRGEECATHVPGARGGAEWLLRLAQACAVVAGDRRRAAVAPRPDRGQGERRPVRRAARAPRVAG